MVHDISGGSPATITFHDFEKSSSRVMETPPQRHVLGSACVWTAGKKLGLELGSYIGAHFSSTVPIVQRKVNDEILFVVLGCCHASC